MSGPISRVCKVVGFALKLGRRHWTVTDVDGVRQAQYCRNREIDIYIWAIVGRPELSHNGWVFHCNEGMCQKIHIYCGDDSQPLPQNKATWSATRPEILLPRSQPTHSGIK